MGDSNHLNLGERVAGLEARSNNAEKRAEEDRANIEEIRDWNKQVYAEIYMMKVGGRIAFFLLPFTGGIIAIVAKQLVTEWMKN